MNATYSVEAKIQNFMTLRDTTADFISGLAQLEGISGASSSRLSQAFRGRNLPEETAAPLGNLIDNLEMYCASVHPIPVSLRNPFVIKGLLDDFRKRHEERVRPTPFGVVLLGPALFKRIVSGEIETTTSYQECAAFKDAMTAHAAARILNGMGQMGVRFTTITNAVRAPETFVSKLADVGFEQ
jgi:hypothetical protein